MKAMGYSSKVVTDATLDSTTGNITVSKIENGTSGSSTLDLASIYAKKTDLLEYRIDGYGQLTAEQYDTIMNSDTVADYTLAITLRQMINSMEPGKLYILITEELANPLTTTIHVLKNYLSLWRLSDAASSGVTRCIEKVMDSNRRHLIEFGGTVTYNDMKKLVREEIHVDKFPSSTSTRPCIWHNKYYIFNKNAFAFDSSTNTLNIDLDID